MHAPTSAPLAVRSAARVASAASSSAPSASLRTSPCATADSWTYAEPILSVAAFRRRAHQASVGAPSARDRASSAARWTSGSSGWTGVSSRSVETAAVFSPAMPAPESAVASGPGTGTSARTANALRGYAQRTPTRACARHVRRASAPAGSRFSAKTPPASTRHAGSAGFQSYPTASATVLGQSKLRRAVGVSSAAAVPPIVCRRYWPRSGR